MAKKVFVGNLDWGVDNTMLEEFFSQAGTVVSAFVVKDRETRRSRGFGFVEFEKDEDAQKAIEMFDGAELNGRENLKVAEADEKPSDNAAPSNVSSPSFDADEDEEGMADAA